MKALPIIAAMIAATLVTAPANAASDNIPTRVVRYADLNLATAAGQATLNRRIVNAARAVCAADNNPDLRARQAANKCYRTAIASANRQAEIAVANSRGTSSAAQ